MEALIPIIFSIAIIILAGIIILRIKLAKKSSILSDEILSLTPYTNIPDVGSYISIPTDLNNTFKDRIICATEKQKFINHYITLFDKVSSLFQKLKILKVKPSDTIKNFISDFESINILVKQHNDIVIKHILDTNKDFFDHCLQYPLDKQQRRSIVSEEDNCLVVSSAGSGKTSSIVGKVKYLTEIKGIDAKKILLISYTNKAAAELSERMSSTGIKGYTFHKLALDLIGKTTGTKPSICENTDLIFVDVYHQLLNEPSFQKSVVEYFIDYHKEEDELERMKDERREQLTEQKKKTIKTMFPDMDGKTVYVRSEQENKICTALSSLGVDFRYEEPYEHRLADENHSQYRPDFSIYFEHKGEPKRIYLEHFGIDEHSCVPKWFAEDKNMTYEEANKKYNDGITWKREAHKKFGTELITTSSADFHYSDIKEKLKYMLKEKGVTITERSNDELYNLVLPKGSKHEKAFIRLVVTFANLIKSSCKSIDEILRQIRRNSDERSEFLVENIFQPVFEGYTAKLNELNQIDFTDAIIQATEICNTQHPVEYEYIIVDEFQDISVDRYNFLKALRDGDNPAKLYCVGDDWQSIYRFSGSDMSLFNQFPDYFGFTEINKIETTYRFGEPLVSMSSKFIQRNSAQIQKNIHPFKSDINTSLEFYPYERQYYTEKISQLVASVPADKSIFLLGRYSFDDYFISTAFKHIKEGNRFYYIIGNRKIEFLTAHKSKGLEADYVILLQCNKDVYGFPSLISDNPVLNYVLTKSDQFPYGEERRLFYVAITRAKIKTMVLFDSNFPSVFVEEFLHPERVTEDGYKLHPNANKKWTRAEERFLLVLHSEGKTVKQISENLGRSQTSIIMRLNKLGR